LKYCQQCRKFVSALGIEGLTFCVAAKHDIVEKSFEDIYREAMNSHDG